MSKYGIVFKTTGSRFGVLDSASGEVVDCGIRGRLRLSGSRSTSPAVVGDQVEYETGADGESVITGVKPRRNYVIRRSPNLSRESHIIAANIDQALIVATLFEPATSYEFIDRFLVTCEAYHIPAIVALSKDDLARQQPEAADDFVDNYSSAGYPVVRISPVTGFGMDALVGMLNGKTTLVSGNSGVGKSTIISMLSPGANVTVAPVSTYHHKGRHTTTNSSVYPLPAGGYLIDTPGIKGFGLIEIDPAELYHYFPEMLRASADCQFYNCTHTHEPGCAVVEAVKTGEISFHRYESYLKILDEDEKYRK